jgi:hypothetical protein
MNLIAPDLYAEVSRLSAGACGIGLAVGLLLWLTGWWQHQFWTVACLTAAAGLLGLQQGRSAGVQPLVAGLLAALAAGLIAMELAKVLAYAGGGLAAAALARAFVPTVEPLLAFLAGGLLGVVLFRLWMLTLTSFVGTVLIVYCGLSLGSQFRFLDGATLVQQKGLMLSGVVGGGTLLGLLVQGRFDAWVAGRKSRLKAKAMSVLSDEERNAVKKAGTAKPNSIWGKLVPRKAG